MGEVYKAKDTRLERTVAIKVLPQHLSASSEVRQRFEREAKTISSLSHPHICALYDVGNQDGIEYLVMEYLEGETLADRLLKGSLPSEQVLRYGIEIADALDKAHRQGIVHRDLKPGNVMLTKAGVKLLDFGLAKALPSPGGRGAGGEGLTSLPTMASAPLTQEGTILGTFQYMAPEQLEGKEADARTDIFAFGAVLYEMATGKKAFSGTSQASLISSIMSSEPPAISSHQPMTPPALDRVVKTCLAKDPEERWQSAHDIKSELAWIAQAGSEAVAPMPVLARRRSRERLAWALAGVAALAAAWLAVFPLRRGASPEHAIRLSLSPPAKAPFEFFNNAKISPDGLRVAFVAHLAGHKSQLWIRPLHSLSAQALAGTEGADDLFWSPDSRFLGFFADGKLKKIEAAGGPPQVLCDAPAPAGGAWGSEILFAPTQLSPLYRVPATGGTPALVTKLGPRDEAHRYPSFLADGRRFVFLADSWRTEDHLIRAGSLDSKESTTLFQAVSNAVFAPPEYLLFVRAGSLLAQRFDTKTLKPLGDPALVGEQISETGPNHHFDFSASASGVLLYDSEDPETQLAWFDRSGKRLATVGEPARYAELALSPDGERAALMRLDPDGRPGNLWILNVGRGTTSRLTSGAASDFCAIWSPDGRRVLFSSMRSGLGDLYERPSSPAGSDQLLLKSADGKCPDSLSRDGRFLLYTNESPETKSDLWVLPMTGDRRPVPFAKSSFAEEQGQFSPDGAWVAYCSNESGRREVYVQSFSDPASRIQVSSGGGSRPRWRGDGKELFYVSGGKVLSVDFKTAPSLEPASPRELFRVSVGPGIGDYDVARDGQRFLITAPVGGDSSSSATVVLHWTADLKK
jgi:serine/threonine protein kinase/Tol biopolymer transport system component